MTERYSDLSDREFLTRIREASRLPAEELIEAAIGRTAALESGLCQILDSPVPPSGTGGHVLAGLLLIEARALVSIPTFASLYRDPEREPLLSPWFDAQIANIGPPLVMPFRNLLLDDNAPLSGRLSAVEVLNNIAGLYPEQRDKVLESVRSVVQGVETIDDLDDDAVELLSWSVSALVDLGDRDSAEMVRGLTVRLGSGTSSLAELAEYAELLSGGTPSPDIKRPVPILELYAAVRKWEAMSAEDVVEHYKEAMLTSGVDEKLVTSVMAIALARFVGDSRVESGEDLISALKSTLSSAGVAEPDLDTAVKDLLITVFAFDGIESETILPAGLERSVRLRFNLDALN